MSFADKETTMRIHDYPGFPNPLRVRIALAEKDLLGRVEFVHVDVPGGEHKRPAFLAKNPSGAVPVLELEDGTMIAECSAITEYIDQLDGAPSLTGVGARERAVVHMMQRRAEAGLLDAVSAYFHHATPGLGPTIESYQNRGWGEHNRDRAVATMGYLETVLADQPFLAGENFSIADITAYSGLAFGDFANIGVPDGCHRVRDWRRRVGERASVKRASGVDHAD